MTGKLKLLDLFSGIGGFSLGLERTGGFETVAFCEIDTFCQKVLKKHWPDVPVYDDVRTLDYDGTVDIISGGYPCQPFSTAGKRKGAEDDRHLWPSMFSLIKKHRPTWVIGENVAGHISMGLDSVLSDLASEDYQCRTFVIPACAINAKHRRDRIWIVAHSKKLLGDGVGSNRKKIKRQIQKSGSHCGKNNVANTDSERPPSTIRGQFKSISETPGTFQGRELSGRNAKAWTAWEPEPRVDRVVDGIPKRVDRLRGLGNAVVSQIPEMIGYAILAAEMDNR